MAIASLRKKEGARASSEAKIDSIQCCVAITYIDFIENTRGHALGFKE